MVVPISIMDSQYDAQPRVTWDLLQFFFPSFLDFAAQRALGLTCRRLASTWKQQVEEIPEAILIKATTRQLREWSHIRTIKIGWGNTWQRAPYDLRSFTRLTTLQIPDNTIFHDGIWQQLSSLTDLDIQGNECVEDSSVAMLTNLTALNLCNAKSVTDAGISHLTSLTRLDLCYNRAITDVALSRLTNMRELSLLRSTDITDLGLAPLTRLETLLLEGGGTISDTSLSKLTALTHLKIADTKCVGDNSISCLTRLNILNLGPSCAVTSASLKNLKNLVALRFVRASPIRGHQGFLHHSAGLQVLIMPLDVDQVHRTVGHLALLAHLSVLKLDADPRTIDTVREVFKFANPVQRKFFRLEQITEEESSLYRRLMRHQYLW